MREIGDIESRLIGRAIRDLFVAMGHPLTCNGGNDNRSTHHDHEVRMMVGDDEMELVCPECGRTQRLPDYREPD
jgi:hypothetical protein